jgi:hypothetical protein
MPNQYTGPILVEWLKAAIRTHEYDSCLIWPHGKIPSGYGMMKFEGKHIGAHRVAFYLQYGYWPIPVARHSCDNPSCVNPRHIVAGTHADNAQDKVAKGRHCHGSTFWSAKLTPKIVMQIRREFSYGNGAVLGRKFGISRNSIHRIVKGLSWRHIGPLAASNLNAVVN